MEYLNIKRILSLYIAIAFLVNSFGHLPDAQADELILPIPGTLMKTSPSFRPPLIQGIKIDTHNHFHLQFMMEEGQGPLHDEETLRTLRYFLTALTVPEKDIWVNLSPHENKRIIPSVLSTTEMGVDLLGQDYLLKQLASSLLYPEGDEGKEFWKRVYARALQEMGTTNIPLNTINKVWITPGEILVEEKGNMAVISKATLRVMVESDYLALKLGGAKAASALNDKQSLMNDAYRRVVIPELAREVNTGTYFSRVRQIYHTLILAVWYKRHFHQGVLAQSYVNLKETAGVSVEDKDLYGKIYRMYLKAYKKGVFNFIREELDVTGSVTARKYFSGGFDIGPQLARQFRSIAFQEANVPSFTGKLREIDVRLDRAQSAGEYIVDRQKKENLKEMGNKGRNLQENDEFLKGHIPPFEILSSRLYDDYVSGNIDLNDVARAVREKFAAILENGGSLVVRPSSVINMPGILPTDKRVTTVDQMVAAILKIYQSWQTSGAQDYLETGEAGDTFDNLVAMNIFNNKEIAKKTGPAIVIQKEIFGDKNEQSGSGVFISRNTKTGKFLLSGSFGIKTAPEEIRNGGQGITLQPLSPSVDALLPSFQVESKNGFYETLSNMADKLEEHYGYPIEVEFIVEDGKLYVVQVNHQDIPESMRLAVETDMADEGKIARSTIAFPDRNAIRHIGQIKADAKIQVATNGLGLSPGAIEGYLAFSLERVKELREQHRGVIYVSTKVNEPALLQILVNGDIDGLITFYGNYFMHNARIAREAHIPGISLASQEARLEGNEKKTLVIGNHRFQEGGRIVVNAIDEDDPQGNDVIHQAQLLVPDQEESIVEDKNQVSVGQLYFNVKNLQRQIKKQYKGENYTVLTATHALLKAYLMRNNVKGLEANKLEVATNAIHELLDQEHAATQGKDGSREDVFMPIARAFGDRFPFPDIQTIDDIPKAVELMNKFVHRYQQMSPVRVDYLNYPPTDPIMVPSSGDVPLEFSIILSTGEVNWQYENPQLWAYVRGIDTAVILAQEGNRQSIPAEFVTDQFSPDKIRVMGKLNAQHLRGIAGTGQFDSRIGLSDTILDRQFFELQHPYHIQIKNFEEYMRYKISQTVKKNYPLSDSAGIPASKIANFLTKISLVGRANLGGVLTEGEKRMLLSGGFLLRPLQQSRYYTQENIHIAPLNPNKFSARESAILVKMMQQLFPGINVTNQERIVTDVPASLQAHYMPPMYQETYASYILFDKEAFERLAGGISILSQKYDLSSVFGRNTREASLDLEGIITRMFIDRFGHEELERVAVDKAQVGGIDLNLSGITIGSAALDSNSPLGMPVRTNRIKGLIPVIVKQKSILTMNEFVQS